MLNNVVLIGRLTKQPELRYTPTGVACTNFTLAVDRNYKKEGQEREADFIPIVTWRGLAESCANNLDKGRLVAVQGQIQTRHYDNNEGRRVYITEIIADNVRFLDYGKDKQANSHQQQPNHNPDPFADNGQPVDISDEDMPF